MGLEDKIQGIRSNRAAANEANSRNASEQLARAEEAAAALTNLGRSVADILRREGIPLFPEMVAVKTLFANGHTVKLLSGRLWVLSVGSWAPAVSTDGVFFVVDAWRRGVNPAANAIRRAPKDGQPGKLMNSGNETVWFNERADRFAMNKGLLGGYSHPRRMETLGSRPKSKGDYDSRGLYLAGGTLVYGGEYSEQPYEDIVARHLEELLASL